MMKPRIDPKLILFDFDGTLVDSLDPVVEKVNQVMKKISGPQFREEQVEHFLAGKSSGAFKKTRPTRWLMNRLTHIIEQHQLKHVAELGDVLGLSPVLKQLHQQGIKLGIVTSNTEAIVRTYIKKKKWENYFSIVVGGQNLYEKNKVIQQLLVKKSYKPNDVVYVGDEVRDIEAARAAGVKSIAVSWGFQAKADLRQASPDWLIDKPQQLLLIVNIRPWWHAVVKLLVK